MESGPFVTFILAALATWRVTHLLSREDGPADLLAFMRARLGDSHAGRLMDCFNCLSLWVAALLAFVVSKEPVGWLLAWFALSGASCLLERVGQDPVVIQPIPEGMRGGPSDGMLRSEPHGADRPSGGDHDDRDQERRL